MVLMAIVGLHCTVLLCIRDIKENGTTANSCFFFCLIQNVINMLEVLMRTPGSYSGGWVYESWCCTLVVS